MTWGIIDTVETRLPSHRLPATLWTALHHGRQLWRALRHGDQSIMVSTLLDLARRSPHPDAYLLDARPLGPAILVLHSAEGLRALGEHPALDKGPTANIAVAVTGEAGAYEGIMGPAQGGPYLRQIELLDALIKRVQRGLRRVVQRRVGEHLAPPCELSIRRVQYFTASVILEQIFPAHAWTPEAIAEVIDALEHNAEWVGPTIQASAMKGHGPTAVLERKGLSEVIDRYERVFAPLAEEERARRSAATAPTGERDDTEPEGGLLTQLLRDGLSWADTKALATTFIAASYETVSSVLTEWVYQVSASPPTWRALQDAEGELRRQRIKASLYEAVRLVTPLPLLLRRAERACTLDIVAGDGTRRPLSIESEQLVMGLNVAPLRDPAVFPDPLRMRLELDAAQRERIRLAWGLEAAPTADGPNRFCQGFSYSVALLTATIESLLADYAAPTLVRDAEIDMVGTQARRRFVARLAARA